jgi:V/A-type H+-transporting ATPase subunit I
MLKTTRMRKFRAIVLQRMHDQVVAKLHEAGVVQLKEISGVKVTRKALDDEFYEISSLLGELRGIQEFLGTPAKTRPKKIKELTYQQTLKPAKSLLKKIEPKVNELRSKSKALDEDKQTLLAQVEVLEEIKGIESPLRYLRPSKEIHVVTGRIEEDKSKSFLESVRNSLDQRVFAAALGEGKKRIVIVACRTRDKPKLLPILYRHEVEPLELPSVRGTPKQALDLLRKKLARVEKREASLQRRVRGATKAWAREVTYAIELLDIQRERLEGSAAFGYTDTTTLIEGWVPAKQVPKLERLLSRTTRRRYIFRTYEPQHSEIEETPIEMENPPVVKDFESITGMYGLPKYNEVDPTLFLSFTFPLFFAICLSDAGYGILLGLFMASGFWIAKSFPRDFRVIMVIAAAFTVLIGALMGGWFGAGPTFWVNPIENPIPILKLAVFIGIIHILLGFGVVAVIKDAFRRDWGNLFLNHVPRALIIVGFFGLGFCALGVGLQDFGVAFTFPKMGLFEVFNPFAPASAIVVVFRILLYAGLGVGMAGAVVLGRDLREKFSGPINVLYGITGLVADAASYTRLMALGMATCIIAYAINFILGWVYGGLDTSLSVASMLVTIPMLILLAIGFIVGHCFNIFINCLGGFIHTLRLHYVEFFGKFYEGGGERFAPFKVKRKFTKLKMR